MKKWMLLSCALLLASCTTTLQTKQEKHETDSVTSERTLQFAEQPKSETTETSLQLSQSSQRVETTQLVQETQSSSKIQTSTKHSATKQEIVKTNESKQPNLITVEKKEGQKYLLNVKSQIQQVWHYCAPTTVSMILSARGIHVDQFTLAKEMGTYEPFGTHNKDAIRILNKHLFGYEYPKDNQAGYRLETVTDFSPQSKQMALFKERLKRNIKDGYPMYYTIDVSRIYKGSKGEHNVAGIGYQTTPDGQDIAYLYFLDPSPSKQHKVYGALKKITVEQLFHAMELCTEPNYAW